MLSYLQRYWLVSAAGLCNLRGVAAVAPRSHDARRIFSPLTLRSFKLNMSERHAPRPQQRQNEEHADRGCDRPPGISLDRNSHCNGPYDSSGLRTSRRYCPGGTGEGFPGCTQIDPAQRTVQLQRTNGESISGRKLTAALRADHRSAPDRHPEAQGRAARHRIIVLVMDGGRPCTLFTARPLKRE